MISPADHTRQTFTGGNYVAYTYDNIGQLKTARGWEADTTTARLEEQFGYAYDKFWNLQNRTNNALVQTFGVNNRNELTNATRSGTLTVAGLASQPGANLDHVAARPVRYVANGAVRVETQKDSSGRSCHCGKLSHGVNGTGLSSGNANVYADGSWARAGATLASGNNSYTATAEDTYGRTAQDSVSLARSCTLLYRRISFGKAAERSVTPLPADARGLEIRVTAGWKPALRALCPGQRQALPTNATRSGTYTVTSALLWQEPNRWR